MSYLNQIMTDLSIMFQRNSDLHKINWTVKFDESRKNRLIWTATFLPGWNGVMPYKHSGTFTFNKFTINIDKYSTVETDSFRVTFIAEHTTDDRIDDPEISQDSWFTSNQQYFTQFEFYPEDAALRFQQWMDFTNTVEFLTDSEVIAKAYN